MSFIGKITAIYFYFILTFCTGSPEEICGICAQQFNLSPHNLFLVVQPCPLMWLWLEHLKLLKILGLNQLGQLCISNI